LQQGCASGQLPLKTKYIIEVWRSWGRFRAPPVADTARKKEWQQLDDWQVSCARADRVLVATGMRKRTTATKN